LTQFIKSLGFDFVGLHGTASTLTNAGEIWFEDVSRNAAILDQCSCSFWSKPDSFKSWSSGNLVDIFIFVSRNNCLKSFGQWTYTVRELQPWAECVQCPQEE